MSRADDLAAVDRALTRIGRVANSRRSAMHRARLSGVDLPPTAVTVLAVIYRHGPLRLAVISSRVELEPSRVSKEVNRLVHAGFVEREPDPSDRRAALLRCTGKGEDAFRRYRKAADDLLASRLEDWSDRDMHRIGELLQRLAESLAGEEA